MQPETHDYYEISESILDSVRTIHPINGELHNSGKNFSAAYPENGPVIECGHSQIGSNVYDESIVSYTPPTLQVCEQTL